MIDAHAPVDIIEEIDSTLLEARRRAERGELSPVWMMARRQSAARGRRGRGWVSIDGNLMLTYLSATTRPPNEIALLSFATGLAIAETFEAYGVNGVTLKWPNDVFVGGAKTAGILIDSGTIPGGTQWMALGFGVNIAGAPEAIDQLTTSLRQELPLDALTPTPDAVFDALRPRLERWTARLDAEGFEPLRRAWTTRAHGLGGEARVMQGDTALVGRLAGLSPRGELELDTAEGRKLISAGDVYFPNAA